MKTNRIWIYVTKDMISNEQKLFLYYYDSNTYKKASINKNLKGPIEEILNSK